VVDAGVIILKILNMKSLSKSRLKSEEFYASKPLPWVKFFRKFIPWQLFRFIVINLKVMKIVAYGHS